MRVMWYPPGVYEPGEQDTGRETSEAVFHGTAPLPSLLLTTPSLSEISAPDVQVLAIKEVHAVMGRRHRPVTPVTFIRSHLPHCPYIDREDEQPPLAATS